MEKAFYEIETNFTPAYNIAIALLSGRGHDNVTDIIKRSTLSVVHTDFTGWNSEIFIYTVYVKIDVRVYSTKTESEIREIESLLTDALNEVTKTDNECSFNVHAIPILGVTEIDWSKINGYPDKSALKRDIEKLISIMINVSTCRSQIPECDTEYKELNAKIAVNCKNLNITYNNTHYNLWDLWSKCKQNFKTYVERRAYISDLFQSTLLHFNFIDELSNVGDTIVHLNNWERVQRVVDKIKRDSQTAKNEEDFQAIGLCCRGLIISLAKEVYVIEKHGATDSEGKSIGKNDAVRMLGNYISSELQGSSNEELRAYAKNTNKLANSLTHKDTANKRDMMLATSATLALINLIGVVAGKY